jgi:hypothetical protein
MLGSVGVTPENNAVVLLQQAFGPSDTLEPELRSRLNQYLDSPEPPAQGDYFVSIQDYGVSKFGSPDVLHHQLGKAFVRQLTRGEFPELAAWIDANEQPMKLVEQASRRSRYYARLIIGGRKVIHRSESHRLNGLQDAVRLLGARALLHLSEGDFENAANDLLTSHRLAWLLRQDLTIKSQIAANSYDSSTTQVDQILLAERLFESFLQRFRAGLDSIPYSHRVRDTLDQGERLYQLAVLQEIGRGNIPPNDEQGTKFISYLKFDVNAAIRQMNRHLTLSSRSIRSKDFGFEWPKFVSFISLRGLRWRMPIPLVTFLLNWHGAPDILGVHQLQLPSSSYSGLSVYNFNHLVMKLECREVYCLSVWH